MRIVMQPIKINIPVSFQDMRPYIIVLISIPVALSQALRGHGYWDEHHVQCPLTEQLLVVFTLLYLPK